MLENLPKIWPRNQHLGSQKGLKLTCPRYWHRSLWMLNSRESIKMKEKCIKIWIRFMTCRTKTTTISFCKNRGKSSTRLGITVRMPRLKWFGKWILRWILIRTRRGTRGIGQILELALRILKMIHLNILGWIMIGLWTGSIRGTCSNQTRCQKSLRKGNKSK